MACSFLLALLPKLSAIELILIIGKISFWTPKLTEVKLFENIHRKVLAVETDPQP